VLLSVTVNWAARHWDFALIFLALATFVPWRGTVRARALRAQPHLSVGQRISLYASTIAFQWLGAAIIVWRAIARGVSLAELGLLPAKPSLGIELGVLMAAALGALQLTSLRLLSRVPVEKRGQLYEIAAKLMPQELTDGLVFVALVGTVSLCEELVFRGFVFAVLRNWSGSVGLAMVGSSALFALGHLYQGRRGVVNTFVLGLLLAGARAWSDSLVPPILAHLAIDLTAGLVGRHATRYSGKAADAAASGATQAVRPDSGAS
jgi:membrane protease YdiL (CAAX protease family)